jgi:S-adenosylmethionine-dependent methyltransferase
MSLSERLESMRYSWEITRSGGAWIVNETPNRLWYYDGHTSLENFFHWLTDDLAILWAHRSRRTSFADAFPPGSNDRKIEFARWGRGVSFHEFDLAIGDTRKIDVISNRHDFLRAHVPAMLLSSLVSKGRRYERFLERLQPEIDKAFFREYLNIAIRKP